MYKQQVTCPHCDGLNTHLEAYNQYEDKDKRLCMHLIFNCEAGHIFDMYIHQHEGQTAITEDKDAADAGDFNTPHKLVVTLEGGE